MKAKKLLLFVLLMGLLTACQDDPRPYGNLTDDTCSAPCWYGITPGYTTGDEALEILQNLDIVKTDSLQFSDDPLQDIGMAFLKFQRSGSAIIYAKDNVVYLIRFIPKTKSWMFDRDEGIDLQFSDAIKKYGEPSSIFAKYQEEPSAREEIWAMYPEKGITFYFYNGGEESKFQKELTPETPVSEVMYYSPANYFKIMDRFIERGTLSDEDIKNSTHPWIGYGSIKEKYPSMWKSEE